MTPDYTEQLASSDAQQAILQLGDSAVSAEYRVRYNGNATDFAWIIPVPGNVDTVEEGSEARFTALEAVTAPTVGYWSESSEDGSSGCGCGGMQAGGLKNDSLGDTANARGFGQEGEPSGVSVVGSGYAGPFVYTVLEAADADGFITWLESEGYDTTISAPAIQAYVDDTIAYSWVTVQLSPDAAATPDGGVVLPPLRVTWSAGEDGELHASYPARMASTSMLAEVRTEIYVLAESRTAPGNGWEAAPRDYETWDYSMNGTYGADPVEVYDAALRQVGTSHRALYPVWGGSYQDAVAGDVYVTRYDTIVAPATNQSDVTFDETGESQPFYTLIGIPEGEAPSGAWLLPLGLGGLLLRRRR